VELRPQAALAAQASSRQALRAQQAQAEQQVRMAEAAEQVITEVADQVRRRVLAVQVAADPLS
jgi:hypothetical protein